MRTALIFLLILHHDFAPYAAYWPSLDATTSIGAYKWMAIFTHHFRLQTMTFISGLLFGYTLMAHPERRKLRALLPKKAQRLWVPCICFSIVYIALFDKQSLFKWDSLHRCINGVGHLWYLPMIFWCFVVCDLLERIRAYVGGVDFYLS